MNDIDLKNLDQSKIYRISKSKRIFFQISAIILFCFGFLPCFITTIFLKSILPLLGGVLLAFFAYTLFISVSQTMQIKSEGLLFKNRRKEYLLKWSDVSEFTLGEGNDRYKVKYKYISEPDSTQINVGPLFLEKIYYLPDTFGMKADELAAILEQMRKEKIK